MCAVIGAILKDPRRADFDMLHRVFLESKIRGMHATGLSYVKANSIVTQRLPVSADKFPFNFESYLNEDGSLYLVGHCRYSTSDLEFNQPIANSKISVVHNGVITQELPEHWVEKYGYTCDTKNDTELILKTLEANQSPLERWSDASLAVCELYVDKKLRVYRNGQRPLYLTSVPSGCIITSTWNIAERANVGGSPVNLLMNHYTTFDENLAMTIERVDIAGAKDLQDYELC
jgi:glutamine phosphoribosylpyrophosphate amidotransferase